MIKNRTRTPQELFSTHLLIQSFANLHCVDNFLTVHRFGCTSAPKSVNEETVVASLYSI